MKILNNYVETNIVDILIYVISKKKWMKTLIK